MTTTPEIVNSTVATSTWLQYLGSDLAVSVVQFVIGPVLLLIIGAVLKEPATLTFYKIKQKLNLQNSPGSKVAGRDIIETTNYYNGTGDQKAISGKQPLPRQEISPLSGNQPFISEQLELLINGFGNANNLQGDYAIAVRERNAEHYLVAAITYISLFSDAYKCFNQHPEYKHSGAESAKIGFEKAIKFLIVLQEKNGVDEKADVIFTDVETEFLNVLSKRSRIL